VAIKTALTEAFGLKYPIVLAPMASVAGGHLAAEVSNSGGLGLVGGGYGDPDWLREELSLARDEARRPWGVGLITWCATRETVDLALGYEPNAFMLSFGDSSPYASVIKETGCKLICQVQDIEGALAAEAAGADFIVAQGTEAGGHGAEHASTLPLVPAVVDAVDATPVLAAGGIADGRGLAAAHAFTRRSRPWGTSRPRSRSWPLGAAIPSGHRSLTWSVAFSGRRSTPVVPCATTSSNAGTVGRSNWPRRRTARTRPSERRSRKEIQISRWSGAGKRRI
jgi:NAD(P)H-dependent flavin oxidoreductase YrpB (nitropropane dioxygenase family)